MSNENMPCKKKKIDVPSDDSFSFTDRKGGGKLMLGDRETNQSTMNTKENNIEITQGIEESMFSPRVVDLQLLSNIQNELKYQIYSTWRHLNLVETYEENETVISQRDKTITAHKFLEEKGLKDDNKSMVCCLKCCKHIEYKESQSHMIFAHNFEGQVNNCHSVPVLEMDKANLYSRISCQIIKKIGKGDYFLFCRLCLSPIEVTMNKSIINCIEIHQKNLAHRNKVKEFFAQSDVKDGGLPLFLELIQVKYDPNTINQIKESNKFIVYHPHEFILSCCCRSVECKFCDTSPYIFSNTIPPHTKVLDCLVCNRSFKTSIGHHQADIVKHASSKEHFLKHRELLAKDGFVPPDVELFFPSKSQK